MRSRRWLPRPAPFPDALPDPDAGELPPPLTEVLARRGLSGGKLAGYLSPDTALLLRESDIPGVTQAAQVLCEAIRSGSMILVHGDFDADGITATALMRTGLGRCGAETAVYIPDRFRDGYGLSPSGVRACVDAGAGLLLSVDCGMTAVAEVARLKELGIRTVITDHHSRIGPLPGSDALVNPVLAPADSMYSDLSGAGVAWIVLAEVSRAMGHDPLMNEDLLQLAALGTVCDVVDLSGFNRVLVREGLRLLRQKPIPGLLALAATASIDLTGARSSDLAFHLGPRLNACGRIGHASEAVELLLCPDLERAKELAVPVDIHNRERRRLDGVVRESAMSMAGKLDSPRCLVLYGADWHRGVVGIAASRLTDRFGVPAILLSVEDGMAYGSARSVPGISILALLEKVQDDSGILATFGGHPAAAGLSLASSRIGELRERLEGLLAGEEWDTLLGPVLYVDGRLEGHWMTLETVRALEMLEPFGEGNREPVWIARGVRALNWRAVGRRKDHLSCLLRVGERDVRGIGFGLASKQSLFGGPVDIAFTIEEDRWRGDGSVQLHLRDVRRQRPVESS